MTRSTRAMDTRWSSRIRCLALASFVRSAWRRAFPPGHEVVGCDHIAKQVFGIAFQLTNNLRGELVVLLAERSDPGRERKWLPVAQVSREGD